MYHWHECSLPYIKSSNNHKQHISNIFLNNKKKASSSSQQKVLSRTTLLLGLQQLPAHVLQPHKTTVAMATARTNCPPRRLIAQCSSGAWERPDAPSVEYYMPSDHNGYFWRKGDWLDDTHKRWCYCLVLKWWQLGKDSLLSVLCVLDRLIGYH